MTKDNIVINIQGWMINKLKLKENELIIYALIYELSPNNNFYIINSDKDISDICNINRNTVNKIINKLISANLIERIDVRLNNKDMIGYRVISETKEVVEEDDDTGPIKIKDVIELYNNTCTTMPSCRTSNISPARKKRVKKILLDEGYDTIFTLFKKASESDFLKGWKGCNFDWLIAPKNMEKVLEGRYDNRDVIKTKNYIPEKAQSLKVVNVEDVPF